MASENHENVAAKMRLTRALVDLLPQSIPDPGPMESEAELESDDFYPRSAAAIREETPSGQSLWVFAIGSLIWKPRFRHSEKRNAIIEGWHRSFCLGPDRRYRGNPDAPGLMLSLDEGGTCEGVVYRLDEAHLEEDLLQLIESEPPIPPIWLDAKTPDGTVKCIAFHCPKTFIGYEGGLSVEETADRLAGAVGKWGSMPDYLYNTVVQLESHGIHDEYLWKMQELVAQRLENLEKNPGMH